MKSAVSDISARRRRMRMSRTKRRMKILLILAGILILCAVFADHICPYDPYMQNYKEALMPPSVNHLLGTDRFGRDMLSRVIMGARASVLFSLILAASVSVVGTAVGVLCGFLGKVTDAVIMRIADIFLAFPGLVLALALAAVLNGGLVSAVLALAAVSWPKYARIARSRTMTVKNTDYIQAARLSGSTAVKIMMRHILPNISGQIFVTAVLDIGTMIMEIAGLSFLGLGAQPPMAEWGSMINDGRTMLQTAPWVILAPGIGIFISVVIFNLLGDTVRDLMDPLRKEQTGGK